MIKNNFKALETYVSPAIKCIKIKSRGVLCQSPGFFDSGRASNYWNEGSDGYNNYDDELL